MVAFGPLNRNFVDVIRSVLFLRLSNWRMYCMNLKMVTAGVLYVPCSMIR